MNDDVIASDPQPQPRAKRGGKQSLSSKLEIASSCAALSPRNDTLPKITTLIRKDKNYPPLLEHIHDPPSLLYIRGKIPNWKAPSIAIVGTRFTSSYGREMTKLFASFLAKEGFLIVSGFALGIDFIAHKAAIENGGETVAVFGCGVDIVYPPEHRHFEKTLLENGCFMSEHPPGAEPTKYNFPKRNRIISGICDATLVIEAPEKSGALITARCALEQNRDIYAIPGNVGQKNSVGTNFLIQRSGAMLVTHPADIVEYFREQPPLESKLILGQSKPLLSSDEETIIRLLEEGPRHIDEIIIATKFSPGTCAGILMNLQLRNFVVSENQVYRLPVT